MDPTFESIYNHIRSGGLGFYRQPRGLLSVHGREAVQFLNGLITNDVAKLDDGQQMLAAFPNAQGRLIAVVRVMRRGDRYLFETEDATRERVYNNLFRFTFAGEFFVEELTEKYSFISLAGDLATPEQLSEGSLIFRSPMGNDVFIPTENVGQAVQRLRDEGVAEISGELYETLRIESGVPKFGVDMDETTIVPELGLEGLISYNKGCYIGQEIIARIHFRGHVAKQLGGIILSQRASAASGAELTSVEGKNAGRLTSLTHSPALGRTIALAYIRYDYLDDGTELFLDGLPVNVRALPFVN